MRPETGRPPQPDTKRIEPLFRALRVFQIKGSSRFAGTGDFDSVPPNRLGYDVRVPRARKPVAFIPGHVVPNEGS